MSLHLLMSAGVKLPLTGAQVQITVKVTVSGHLPQSYTRGPAQGGGKITGPFLRSETTTSAYPLQCRVTPDFQVNMGHIWGRHPPLVAHL